MIGYEGPPSMARVKAAVDRLVQSTEDRWCDSVAHRFNDEILYWIRSRRIALKWEVEAADGEARCISASLHAAKFGY